MTSEIRANTLKNRVGLGTVSFTNTGPVVSGIVTANSIDLNGDLDVDGHTNLDNVSIVGIATVTGSSQINFGSGTTQLQISNSNDSDINHNESNGSGLRFRINGQTQMVVKTDSITYGTNLHNYYTNRVAVHSGDIDTYIGFPANDTISFDTAGSERLRINSDRVIIGQDLSNNQPTYNTSTTFVTTHTNNPGAWNAIAIISGNSTGASFLKFGDKDDEDVSQIGHYNADNSLRFYTNGSVSERLRIDSDGRSLFTRGGLTASRNVGTKTGEIQVANSSNSSAITIINYANDVSGPHLMFGKTRAGNATGSTVLQSGDRLGEIAFCGADGTDIDSFGAAIKCHVDGTPGANDMPGRIEFYTTGDGGSSAIERLRIDSSGRVMIGNTAAGQMFGGADDLIVGTTSGARGITIISQNNSVGRLLFSDSLSSGAATYQGQINYNHSTETLDLRTYTGGSITLSTSNTERVTINSTGSVGINKTSPAELLDVYGTIQCSGAGLKIDTHPIVSYASFTDISGGSYAARLGSTGTSTVRSTQIYGGGNHIATFDGVNYRLGVKTTKPLNTLDVRGAISTGRNVARELGTIINVSSEHHSSRAGSNVINGKKNYENQGSDWLAAGGSRTNANLTIDLGSSISCDRFVIYNQNEYQDSQREVKNFTLEGSNDNSNWTTILDDNAGCSNGHEPNPGWSFRIPADRDDDEEGKSYRYWRFTMKDFHGNDSYGGIMELELYETSNTNGEVESEVSTHSLVATDVSAEIVRANGQPAFSVARSGTQPSSGNFGANQAIIFDNDTGNGFFQTGTSPHATYYNTSNGIFTAPMSGIYFFTTTVLVQNSTGNYDLVIKTTARDFYLAPGRKASNPGSTSWSTSGTVYLAFGGEVITYMKKGETAHVRFTTFGGGQIYGSGSWTRFAGYLLG